MGKSFINISCFSRSCRTGEWRKCHTIQIIDQNSAAPYRSDSHGKKHGSRSGLLCSGTNGCSLPSSSLQFNTIIIGGLTREGPKNMVVCAFKANSPDNVGHNQLEVHENGI